MIQLQVQAGREPVRRLVWRAPVLTIGRAPTNDLVLPVDNVSSQHAQIILAGGRYLLRDLHSTNGTMIVRRGRRIVLKGERNESPLELGDQIFLAGPENRLVVEFLGEAEPDEAIDSTILAEAGAQQAELDLETGALRDDYDALRSTVQLARALAGADTPEAVGRLLCRTALAAFPRAVQAAFLVPEGINFVPAHAERRDGRPPADEDSTRTRRLSLYQRCLAQRKGFLFLLERDQVQAVATKVLRVDPAEAAGLGSDQVLLCVPLLHGEHCHGFLQIEAPLTPHDRQSLTRRDLSLATLMGHLAAARLHDLETQAARLKLARKATAGFLAATVGHCFKNLLFVPMSLSKMIPMCLAQGKLDEVHWMLARNSVNIRYLDILSNEFAAASKDPTEGFEPLDPAQLVRDVHQILAQLAPDKIEVALKVPEGMPPLVCHGGALKRLLLNLALNAVDALFGQQRADKGRIELAAAIDETRAEVVLRVRDNGPGIPPPILDNLRAIYRQVMASTDALGELQSIAERVRSTKDQGFKEHYGLGFLFVCQTVQAHQGRLEITSEPGRGTTFEIGLPCRRAVPAARHDTAADTGK